MRDKIESIVDANASSPSKLLDGFCGPLFSDSLAAVASRSAVAVRSGSEFRHSCAMCMLVFMIESMNMLENIELELLESSSASLVPSSSSSSYFY